VKPTAGSVLERVVEFDKIGQQQFLDKYEEGHEPDRWLIRIYGQLYPMKALWVASHEPPGDLHVLDYRRAFRDFRNVGFIDIVAVGEEDTPPIQRPTRKSVLLAMAEARGMGSEAFLDEYTNGKPPKSKYVHEGGQYYPLKALFAASHSPSARHLHFSYTHAEEDLSALGFNVVTLRGGNKPPELDGDHADEEVWEGRRATRESTFLVRNREIVAKVKARRIPLTCEGCNLNFEEKYGTYGAGFIEAHHLYPLHAREGVSKPTTINDFAMLCANCHRMVHRSRPCLTVVELKAVIDAAEGNAGK
jgi:HNH endonuclease